MEKQAPDTFRSNEEPRRGLDPLRIDLVEDRFEDLKGKKLVSGARFWGAHLFLQVPQSTRQRVHNTGDLGLLQHFQLQPWGMQLLAVERSRRTLSVGADIFIFLLIS